MKFHIKTYGCQMNERDSEAARTLLICHGYEAASAESQADIVIVNSCSVRDKAEAKALGKLGLMTAGKREGSPRLVGVIGCMVERLKGELFKEVPGLDFAVGPRRLARLPGVLARVIEGERRVLEAGVNGDSEGDLHGHTEGLVSAFINILLGCNRRCAYCIVPTVRGSEWSRSAADIVREAQGLVAGGCREITLLGQSVMSYGRANTVWPESAAGSARGFTEPLPRLLEALDAIPGLARIRFTSGHPSGCTPDLARAMAALSAVCGHLHLPVQSGSDRILEKMKRGYDTAGYRDAVARLRHAVPDLALTTDIIVGFPTETAEDFESTRRFMKEIEFDNAFIFKYSPRPNTPAAAWKDDVTGDEKMRRNQALLEDQDATGLLRNERLIGQRVDVLVEGPSRRNATRWSGRTRTNKIAIFEPAGRLTAGDIVDVRIERVTPQTLYGRIVSADGRAPSGASGNLRDARSG